MRRENTSDASVAIHWGTGEEEDALKAQFEVLWDALLRYQQANEKYNDNWKRMGWRGMLVRVRERAERLWDDLWDAAPRDISEIAMPHIPHDVDDAIDLINFAAFLVRAVRDGNRDGSWWPSDDLLTTMARTIGREVREHAEESGVYGASLTHGDPSRATIRDAEPVFNADGRRRERPTPYDIMEARRGEPLTDLLLAELNAELQSLGYHGVIEVVHDDPRTLRYKETLQ